MRHNIIPWIFLSSVLLAADAQSNEGSNHKDSYQTTLLIENDSGEQFESVIEYKYPSYEEYNCIEESVKLVYTNLGGKIEFDDEKSTYVENQLYWRAQDVVEDALAESKNNRSGYAQMSFQIFNSEQNRQLFQTAKQAFEAQEFNQAITLLNQLDSEDSTQICVLGYLGRSYSELKDYDKSISFFDRIIEVSPNNDNAFYSRGWRHKQLGSYQKALNDMLKSHSIDEESWEIHYQLSHLYSLMDQHLAGINYATLGMKYGEKATLLNRRGWAYIGNDNPAMALIDFNQSIELSPEDGENYSGKAKALHELERSKEALVAINHAMEINELDQYDTFLKASILDDMGQLEEAVKYYQIIFDQFTPDRATYNNLGYTLIKMNSMQAAADTYELALANGHESVLIRNNSATAYYSLKQYDEAEQAVKAAMRIEGNDSLAFEWTFLARIKLQMNQYEDAFEYLKKAKLDDTEFSDAYYQYKTKTDGNNFNETLDALIKLTDNDEHEIVHIKAKLLKEK